MYNNIIQHILVVFLLSVFFFLLLLLLLFSWIFFAWWTLSLALSLFFSFSLSFALFPLIQPFIVVMARVLNPLHHLLCIINLIILNFALKNAKANLSVMSYKQSRFCFHTHTFPFSVDNKAYFICLIEAFRLCFLVFILLLEKSLFHSFHSVRT